MTWSRSDTLYMRRALTLAKRGTGFTSPNPMVGAVVVKDSTVVAEGYHRRFGGPHAEVEAIRSAPRSLSGATMYVNLEPCSHFGKTPPCANEIVKAGISRVIVATLDPNPKVTGRGTQILEQNGVRVEIGLLASQAETLNEAYIKHTRQAIPFVIMKAALTLDGKIADAAGQSQWISCERSRRLVHRLRREIDSVLVGIGTVLSDDPQLTVRLVPSRRNPTRIVLDPQLKISSSARILGDEAPTILVASAGRRTPRHLTRGGCKVWEVDQIAPDTLDLRQLLKMAGAHGITSMLIEGGSSIYSSFLREDLVDKFYFFIAPILLGDGVPLTERLKNRGLEDSLRLTRISHRKIGSDILLTAYRE